MYIDIGERIAGKQDMGSLIFGPPPPQIAQNIHFITFWPIQTGVQIVAPCCTYVSTVMRSAFADIPVPLVPWILCKGPTLPPIFVFIFVSELKRFLSDCFYI